MSVKMRSLIKGGIRLGPRRVIEEPWPETAWQEVKEFEDTSLWLKVRLESPVFIGRDRVPPREPGGMALIQVMHRNPLDTKMTPMQARIIAALLIKAANEADLYDKEGPEE